MSRITLLKLVCATIVLSVVSSLLMLAIDWNGPAASTEAGPIDSLLNVSIVMSCVVFSIVMVALIYFVWRWRAKPGDMSDGDPLHGNTRLEVIWTLIPTVLVLFLAGYSWVVLDEIEGKEPDRLVVDVYSQQFAWSFDYRAQEASARELHVPVNRQVEFRMHALDVIHSFWVPEWRMKKDNVPGVVTHVLVTPNRRGSFQLVCTELCGAGHGVMRAPVVVESPAAFERWVRQQDPIPKRPPDEEEV